MKRNRNLSFVFLMFVIFAVISFLTNIINPLIPDVKRSFGLSNAMAGLLPFAFFIAYGLLSIPSGILLEKTSAKFMTIVPFLMAFVAALGFAMAQSFPIYLISLFSIGAGMAMLQVTINPLLRSAGGKEHFAAYSVFGQLFFGGAGYLGPQLYQFMVAQFAAPEATAVTSFFAKFTTLDFPWISLYWIFAAVSLSMVAVLWFVRFPSIELNEDEQSDSAGTYLSLFKNKTVILFFLGIFAYVGTEQGIGNWISEYLVTYHQVDPQTTGANAVSLFWALLTIGCMLGLIAIKLFDSRKILVVASSCAILSLTAGLFGPGEWALIAFPMVGFFASVMWSIIVSLALNSIPSNHGAFSGILCTGIMGGAIVPLIIGSIADVIGLRLGMTFLYVTLGYILSIGLWAKPLVKNSTISLKQLFSTFTTKA